MKIFILFVLIFGAIYAEGADTPLPSLAESVVPIGNTFGTDGDNIYAIKEDGGLWRVSQNGESAHILDNSVSIWRSSGRMYAHRTDGSLWKWERFGLDSEPRLFLEDVAYFDGRLFAIKFDGSLWGWSWDNIPVHVMDDVVAFSTWLPGSSTFHAITSDSRLWGWGMNYSGAVGDGTDEDRPEPVLIMENIAAVSTARFHSAAICHDGYLWAWGGNQVDGTDSGLSPVRVMGNVVAVSAETYSGPNPSVNTFAIRTDGSLWGWGWDWGGYTAFELSSTPAQIWHDTAQIVRGWRTAMVITSNGELWDLTYEPVMILERVAAASMNHPILALDYDGILWAWEVDLEPVSDIQPVGASSAPRQIMDGVLLP